MGAKKRIVKFEFKSWFRENRLFLAALAVIILAIYIPFLGNDFVADDVYAISGSGIIDSFKDYVLSASTNILHPLKIFLIHQIFGLNPVFFRLPNILFHFGSACLVYLLVYFLANRTAAVIASLLFAAHPLLTESVTWISGGYYAQYSFFLLVALLFYVFSRSSCAACRASEKRRPVSARRRGGDRSYIWHLLISASPHLLFLLALLTSEKAAVFPFILLAFTFAFGDLKKDWKRLLPFFVIGGGWILFYVNQIPQRSADLVTNFSSEAGGGLNPLTQIPIAISSYLELIFWPQKLTLYHSEMMFSTGQYLFKLAVALGLFGLIIYSFKKNRPLFFWLSLFVIPLLPMLTPFGISWIVAERYVYLGSVGVFAAIAILLAKLMEKEKYKGVVVVSLSLIVPLLMTRSLIRNTDWKNQDTLWIAAAKTSPSSPQNHNNLGDLYGRQGNSGAAIREFQTAIALNPSYADAYHNLANTYQQMGKVEEAIKNYQKAVEFRPHLWQSYQSLAAIYFAQEDFERAEENMKKAVEFNPGDANLWVNLGIVYLELGDSTQAESAFRQAQSLNPQVELLQTEPHN